MSRVFFMALGVLFLISGCVGGPKREAEPTPSTSVTATPTMTYPPYEPPVVDNKTLDPRTIRPELQGCDAFFMILDLPKSVIQPHVPAGYTLRNAISDEDTFVSIPVLHCESIILDNETVLRGQSVAFIRSPVDVNESLEGDIEVHHYLFEFVVENETLRDLLLAAGLPAVLASIEVTGDSPNAQVSVHVGGETWYDMQVTGSAAPEGSPSIGVARNHHVPETGPPAWFDFNSTTTGTADVATLTIQATNGFLREISSMTDGNLVGISGPSTASAILRFGHL